MSEREKNKKRILLRVAYDGTAYAGYQIQPGEVKTIEGVLQSTLRELTGEEIVVIGGSRTDAGVHARDNVAVFDTLSPIPGEKFSYALNQRLPEDIRVHFSAEVPEDFHPRHQAVEKTYVYRIVVAPFPDPLRRLYAHYTYGRLDVPAMQAAAQALVGEHDFTSFSSLYSQAASPVRRITVVEVTETGEGTEREIAIRVTGNGFLYHMVRIIAGTLLEVGQGRRSAEEMSAVLEGRDRRLAGRTAPACGLCLERYRFLEDAPGADERI